MTDRSVFKYALPLHPGPTVVKMPDRATIVHVAEQGHSPTLWAVVDETQPMVDRTFVVVYTGTPFNVDGCEHIGTCVGCGFHRGLVLHIFEAVV